MKMIRKISSAGLWILAASAVSMVSLQVYAQDKGIDIDIDVNKKDDLWYKQPWVWVVGAAVFVLILVALLRGKKN